MLRSALLVAGEGNADREDFGATIVVRCCLASDRHRSRFRRPADPVEPRRRGRELFGAVRARPAIGRTGRHRWTLPLGLHVGAQYRSQPPHLRHAQGRSGLSRRYSGRPTRTSFLGFGRHARHRRDLSGARSRLDHATRRTLPQAAPASRSGTRGDLSVLQLARRGYFGSPCPERICAEPSIALRNAASKLTPRICQR
jgi:hypothetical protein